MLKTEKKARPQAETKARTRFEVKALDTEERTFEGLASTWEQDLGGDVIHEGAFKRTLDHWRKSGRAIPLIDQHNYGSVRSVVGKLLEAKETKDGLETKWEVIEGPDGDEILRRLKGGYIDGLSIGYRAIKTEEPSEEEMRAGVWRHLKEVELKEVSVVIWGMNPDALVDTDSVKALLAKEDRTDEENAELEQLRKKIDRALAPASKEDPPEGLAPDDPTRLVMEETLREITLRSLGTR